MAVVGRRWTPVLHNARNYNCHVSINVEGMNVRLVFFLMFLVVFYEYSKITNMKSAYREYMYV